MTALPVVGAVLIGCLLAVVAVAIGSVGALAGALDVPGWYLLAGLASPRYITSGILLFPASARSRPAGCS